MGFLTPDPQLNQAHVGHRWGHTLPKSHLVLPSPGAQVPIAPFMSVTSRLLISWTVCGVFPCLSVEVSGFFFFFFHHASGLVVALFFQEEEVAAYLPPTPLVAFCSHFPSVQDLLKLYTVESN